MKKLLFKKVILIFAYVCTLSISLYGQTTEWRIDSTGNMGGHDGYYQSMLTNGTLLETDFIFEENNYLRAYAFKMAWQDSFTLLPESTYIVKLNSIMIGDSWTSWVAEPTINIVVDTITVTVHVGTFTTFVINTYLKSKPDSLVAIAHIANNVGRILFSYRGGTSVLSSYSIVGGSGFYPLAVGNWWRVQPINIEGTHTYYIEAGWNLLSVPLIVSNGVKTSLFPTATSDAFIYEGFYTAKETLENGYGFWLKFENPEIIQITGDEIQGNTIEVKTGWNIIGSITTPILLDSIRSEPPGIVASEFFYYDGTYQSSDTIKPGLGYWVKVNQPGSLILSSRETTCPGIPVVEYAGKTYNTVLIGSRCWLKENLDVGTMINGSQDMIDNGTIEKYCYNNEPTKCDTYGGLYQWDEAMQYTISERAKGICPLGWHLPTLAEYQTLSTYVGENSNALKAIGQGTGDGAGTNTSGFTALLGGYRDTSGIFGALNILVLFWSSSEHSSSIAYDMRLNYNHTEINFDWNVKNYGWYVRCIKD